MSKAGITQADVRRLARLAHLELETAEVERLVHELGAIVAYVDRLQSVDVAEVGPTARLPLERHRWRPDEPRPSLDRRRVLDQAPARAAGGFVVPRVIGEEPVK